jgi:hypothetical protein
MVHHVPGLVFNAEREAAQKKEAPRLGSEPTTNMPHAVHCGPSCVCLMYCWLSLSTISCSCSMRLRKSSASKIDIFFGKTFASFVF